MRELDRVPANPAIQVDPRIYTKVVGFSEQAVSADSLPNDLHREEFFRLGDQGLLERFVRFFVPRGSSLSIWTPGYRITGLW